MTPDQANQIIETEQPRFEASYVEPPDPDSGPLQDWVRGMLRVRAWETHMIDALLAADPNGIDERPTPKAQTRDKRPWYDRQIAATERRIERNQKAIDRWASRPVVDTSDARAMVNAPLRQRQKGMKGEMAQYRAYRNATADLPIARSRLAWLHDHYPTEAA